MARFIREVYHHHEAAKSYYYLSLSYIVNNYKAAETALNQALFI
jgi:hypothetical protein